MRHHPQESGDDVTAHARGLEALRRWSGQARYARQQSARFSFELPIASAEEVRPGVHLVALTGIVDAYTAAGLAEELGRLARERKHLVVDLSDVRLIDSCGLSALLGASLASRGSGGTLTLVAGNPQVMHGFELCGLDRLIPVAASRAEALASLAGAPAPAR